MALGFLFFVDEVLVAHHSEAQDQPAKLSEVHTVVLVCVQVLEDVVQLVLVIGFLQVRKVLANMYTTQRHTVFYSLGAFWACER